MILTQCFRDLGSPADWCLIGAYAGRADDACSPAGYGVGYLSCLEVLDERLQEKYGVGIRLINAKFERLEGRAHPSYGHTALFVTGDLYLEPVTERRKSRQNGLIELQEAMKKGKE
jgi:hypothetical protein